MRCVGQLIAIWGIVDYIYDVPISGAMELREERTLVATFSDRMLAEAYVEGCCIREKSGAVSRDRGCVRRGRHRYRKGTLLRYYDSVEIVIYQPIDVPHNPLPA